MVDPVAQEPQSPMDGRLAPVLQVLGNPGLYHKKALQLHLEQLERTKYDAELAKLVISLGKAPTNVCALMDFAGG